MEPTEPEKTGLELAIREKPVEETKKESEHITIRVMDQNSNELYFKMKPNTPMKKLMDAYCLSKSVDKNTLRFLIDGKRITENCTPKSLEIEDGDVIDVAMSLLGG